MNLRFLEAFVWAARLRKMTAAAKRLHATDATISARIASFEADMGVAVFQREKGRDLRLTAAGQAMLRPAEDLLACAEQFVMQHAAGRFRQPQSIRIGINGTVAAALLESLVELLQRRWPSLKVHLLSMTSQEIRRQVQSAELEIGLVLGRTPDANVVNLALMELDYVWVASPKLFPPEFEPSIDDLKSRVFLSYNVGSDITAAVAPCFGVDSLADFKVNTFSSLAAMIRLAKAGSGYTVLPAVLVRELLADGLLRTLDLGRTFPPQSCYACFVDSPPDPLRRSIAEAICEAAQALPVASQVDAAETCVG